MTDHIKAAIEALQQMTLTGKRQLTPAQAKECVEAALPHIREMIAQEIMAEAGYPSAGFIRYHSFTKAAQIALGPQQ